MEGECPVGRNLVFAQTGTSRRKRKETGESQKSDNYFLGLDRVSAQYAGRSAQGKIKESEKSF
jgi:hypothetical protein